MRDAELTCCLSCAGLLGGHSGLNIGEDRGNAVIFAAQLVDLLLSSIQGTRLADISGGDKRNALPREASAIVLVSNHCCSQASVHMRQSLLTINQVSVAVSMSLLHCSPRSLSGLPVSCPNAGQSRVMPQSDHGTLHLVLVCSLACSPCMSMLTLQRHFDPVSRHHSPSLGR